MTRRRLAGAVLAAALGVTALGGCGGAGSLTGKPLPRPGPTQAGDPVGASEESSRAPAAAPARIVIPAIEVDAPVVPVGLQDDGAMEVPDAGQAAWYTKGPVPGNPGPAVVLAHVSTKRAPDVFWRLRDLEPGDRVTLVDAEGVRRSWRVTRSEQTDKDELPVERIWNRTKKAELRLVTCAGSIDPSTGHYEDNLVVYALPETS